MAERGPRHRFELTRLEIGGVIVSAAATLFVVFLLGVYAGRGMDSGNAGAQQLVRLPVAAATEADGGDDKWTFDETLPEGKAAGTQHAAAAQHAAPAARDAGSGSAPPAREETQARADVAAHPPSGERDAAADAADTEASGAAPAHAKEATKAPAAAEKKGGRPADAEPTPRPRIAVAMVSVAATPQAGRGEWSVQVTATKDVRAADAMVQRLKARGYQAYVQRVQRSGETLYRVRVGKYPTLENANQIVTRLRREPGVPEAFVASD